MVVYCGICNYKAFVNNEALGQHARENQKHRKREEELRQKQSKKAVQPAPTQSAPSSAPPPASSQPAVSPNHCTPCKLDFATGDELQLHYSRGDSPWHPKCVRCGEGHKDHTALVAHMSKAHPMTLCKPCQKYIYVSELEKHHSETPLHSPYACEECDRRFVSEELLQKHYRDDGVPWHKICDFCRQGFMNEEALEAHMITAHPAVFCQPCNRNILEEDLGRHWTESPNHPTCTACNASFENEETFREHSFDVHPELSCRPCNFASHTAEGLQEHFSMVMSHPKCPACGVRFRNDSAILKHQDTSGCSRSQLQESGSIQAQSSRSSSLTVSPSPTKPVCETCARVFKNDMCLNQHYRDHSAHPTCKQCLIGFKDPAAYEAHMSTAHPAPSQSASQEPVEELEHLAPAADTGTPEIAGAESPIGENDVEQVGISPLHDSYQPDSEDAQASALSTPRSESDVADLQRSLAVEIPQPMLRASSEPPLSSVFNPPLQVTDDIAVESQAETWTTEQSIASQAEDLGTRTTSPQVQSVESESVTPSPVLTPQAREPEPISPMPSLPPSILSPAEPLRRDASPEELTPHASGVTRKFPFHWGGSSPASESTSGPSSPAGAQGLLFSRYPEKPAGSTAPGANGRSSSRASRPSSVASSRSADRKSRTRSKSNDTETTQMSTSHTHVEEQPVSPHPPKPSMANVQAPGQPRLSWHCRACSGTPSMPTVTLCGHLFCRNCIMLELQKHGQCPVCRFTVLVKLHVEA